MSVYFTSDLHLGHRNIIASCGRNFMSVDEMNETLIYNWNMKVMKDDDVYILGDFSYRSSVHVATYLRKLLGKKHLILGNHDLKWIKNIENMNEYFVSICDMQLISIENKLITLTHYPMLEWNRSRYASRQENSTSWLIHGHIHNDTEGMAFRFIRDNLPCALNASVDINNFEPVTFDELLENNNRWYGRI